MPGRRTPPIRVVCLGSGYVAAYLSYGLRRQIRRGVVDLTVVGRDNFHTFHGFIPEMLVGRIQPGQIITPMRRMVEPARFHNAEIQSIDLQRHEVLTTRLLDGREYPIHYDHLVLALGSRDDPSRYPGLAEHAFLLRSYWDALKTRNHIIDMLEMAEIERDPVERRRLLTFVVAGGNYGGVEVATELQHYFQLLVRKEYPGVRPDEVRVVLIHSGEELLPELLPHHVKLQRWAERYLLTTGLEILRNRRLAAATPEEAVLDSGERIPTRTIISCTGMGMPPVLEKLAVEKDERGRVKTDAFCRVIGSERVWAGGDCAAVPHPKGGYNPPLAIFAITTGQTIGKNLARLFARRPLVPYRFVGLGDACSLGRGRAVGHLRGFPFYGRVAGLIRRVFLLYFMPRWDRRLRVVLDWILDPIIGREVVQFRVGDPVALRRELYEAGQEIVRQGEVGSRLYLIVTGQVQVICRGDEGEQMLATLGPGDHFGELAVFRNLRRTATVRALTRVEVIALGRTEAVALSGTIRAFGDEVRALPGTTGGVRIPVDVARANQTPPRRVST
jgi:NADH dehydrogenase